MQKSRYLSLRIKPNRPKSSQNEWCCTIVNQICAKRAVDIASHCYLEREQSFAKAAEFNFEITLALQCQGLFLTASLVSNLRLKNSLGSTCSQTISKAKRPISPKRTATCACTWKRMQCQSASKNQSAQGSSSSSYWNASCMRTVQCTLQVILQMQIVEIEYCKDCCSHISKLKHNSELFHNNFLRLEVLARYLGSIEVCQRPPPDHLRPTPTSSIYFNVKTQAIERYPRIDSFQVYLNGNLVFSRLLNSGFPKNDIFRRLCNGKPVSVPKSLKTTIASRVSRSVLGASRHQTCERSINKIKSRKRRFLKMLERTSPLKYVSFSQQASQGSSCLILYNIRISFTTPLIRMGQFKLRVVSECKDQTQGRQFERVIAWDKKCFVQILCKKAVVFKVFEIHIKQKYNLFLKGSLSPEALQAKSSHKLRLGSTPNAGVLQFNVLEERRFASSTPRFIVLKNIFIQNYRHLDLKNVVMKICNGNNVHLLQGCYEDQECALGSAILDLNASSIQLQLFSEGKKVGESEVRVERSGEQQAEWLDKAGGAWGVVWFEGRLVE